VCPQGLIAPAKEFGRYAKPNLQDTIREAYLRIAIPKPAPVEVTGSEAILHECIDAAAASNQCLGD
jgi:hypothetical protein